MPSLERNVKTSRTTNSFRVSTKGVGLGFLRNEAWGLKPKS